MGRRANCLLGSGGGAGAYDACPTFDETDTYGGLFDTLKCYQYDSTDVRFEPVAGTKASISAKCNSVSNEWDGNFLNWITLRRIDMAKVALIGGSCSVARTASGACPPTGDPSMVTIKGIDYRAFPSGAQISTPSITVGTGANQTDGRVANNVLQGISPAPAPTTLRFHLGGTTGSGPWPLMGWFCTDNDASVPPANATACTEGPGDGSVVDGSDGYLEQGFKIAVALPTEPLGVIQTTGNKVRFALMEYRGVNPATGAIVSNDGGQVLVPFGSFQYRPLNSGAGPQNKNNNTVAMIQGIEDTFNGGNTPMAETFYEATRYVAQVGSEFDTSNYVYPIAFSPGVGLGASGAGSLGTGEAKGLTGSESCPSGYVTDACGRDPYFFGSNHSPAWASPSAQIPCCKTFVILFTDGDSQQDQAIPTALRDFAHGVHGVHCTGDDTSSPTAPINTTCNMHPDTPPISLIQEHRTNFSGSGSHFLDDVAYWAHITDLRAPSVTAQVPGSATVTTIEASGRDLPGVQNVTTYTFFAFSQMLNREFLMQVAKQGGFEDNNNNKIPDNGSTPAPAACDLVDLTKSCEWDSVNNDTGLAGRDGIPDTFFESSDVVFMKDKLTDVITSILSKTSSGSSLSVLASSATGEGALYQSYFYPKLKDSTLNTTINWLGFTHGLFIDTFGNIREDSDQNQRMWYKTDKIIKTHFDTVQNELLVDRYDDVDGNGLPDDQNSDGVITTADCLPCNQPLSSLKPIWEGGERLAIQNTADRRILTWLDNPGGTANGVVDSGEVIEFTTANCTSLSDFLRKVGDACTSGSSAYKIIDFIRGNQPSGMRDRTRTVGAAGSKVWKFGDSIHSTPTEVGPPRERYDVIYGDAGYADFYRHYRDRRRVVYVGANDGMLHAFNAGFYKRGDDPLTTGLDEVERGWFTTTAVSGPGSRGAVMGDELWGFIPQELLPHLEWLTKTDYNHVYYVDLKPKVTEARIFTAESACATDAGEPTNTACKHPGGWATILIGGFRMGGSCGQCTSAKGAPPMTIPIGGVDRTFYSAYFVLDITDPESDPELLWVFSDPGLGLSTSYPSVVRVNQNGTTDTKTSSANEKWFMLVGSGPNGYDADFSVNTQTPKLYAVNLKTGPIGAGNMQMFPVESVSGWKGMIGEIITFDKDLDFRVDAAYMGSTLHDGALPWRGKLYRLTMGTGVAASPGPPLVVGDPFGVQTDVTKWGVLSGSMQTPNELLNTFPPPPAGTIEMGPITTAPAVTLDDANNVWVFAGSGRYYSMTDKTNADTQYFVGVKDPVLTGGCNQTTTDCSRSDLVDVSAATVCVLGQGGCVAGSQVTGVGAAQSFLSLVGTIQSKHGWYTTLSIASRERMISNPIVLGGAVFFPTFIPENDACSSTGDSNLYALYYRTGSAYSSPIIGSTASGTINKTAYIDKGVASAVAIHVGSQGPGGNPTGVTGCVQASSSAVTCVSMNPASPVTSRYISWMHRRD
ncbi:MAG: hypothetical protein L0H94_05400 [Nitrospira sp.]|nr:hypothetical protein [Nitrospira sp.]